MALTAFLIFSLCLLPGSILVHGVVKVVVQEDSDAILPCSPSTKGNLVRTVFDWIKDPRRDVFLYESGTIKIGAEEFRGRVSHFTDELKNGNASIIIRKTKMEDSGNYSCFFPHLQPAERFHIELVVGASPKPNIRILNVTKDGALVECEVRGASPKPEVEFQDRAGNILPAEEPRVSEGGRGYTVTLVTTVTKTDYIRCVAKQNEIHHETSTEAYVPVYDTCSKVDVTGWIGGFFVGVFIVIAVQAVIVATILIRRRRTKESSAPTDVERNYKLVPNGDGQVAAPSAATYVPRHNKLCNESSAPTDVPKHYEPVPNGDGQVADVPRHNKLCNESSAPTDVEGNYELVPNGNGQVAESSAATDVPQHNKLCNGFHQTKSSSNNHLTGPPESDEPLV